MDFKKETKHFFSKKFVGRKYLLPAIIFLALVSRLIYLNVVPPSLTNDEVNIVMNAQSLIKTGNNIPGVVTGIFGNPEGDLSGGIHSEISSYLLIPWFLVFGFTWPYVKLPFVFASLGILILIYLLTKKLVNDKAALISAAIFAISPWSIHFARAAYESIFSAFFYLSAIYFVVSQKGWKIFWSLPFFILGFLSYFSAKTLLLPLTLFSILVVFLLRPKSSFKPIIAVNVATILFLIFYMPRLGNSPAGVRFNELKNQNVSRLVDKSRTESTDFFLISLVENKVAEEIKIRLKASLEVFSPSYLFIDGIPESTPALSIPSHSPLYLIELPLIIFGLIYLAKKNSKSLFVLLGLIATTLLPNFLNLQGTTYMIRMVYFFPLLSVFSAAGIYFFLTEFSAKKFLKYSFGILILISYLLSFYNFLFHYFAKTSIVNAEGWFFHQRILAKYISSSISEFDENIVIYTPEPKHAFYRYLFFSGNYEDKNSVEKINSSLVFGKYEYKKVLFKGECPDSEELKNDPDSIHIISARMCNGFEGNSIASLKDSSHIYVIINDKLCGKYVNRTYPLIKDYKFLNVEKLEVPVFCETLFSNTSGI